MKIDHLDKIYIIHYIRLKERRDYLEKRLKELGLDDYCSWVISDKDGNFSKKDLLLWDSNEKSIQERKKYLGEKLPPIGKIDMIMMLQHIQVLRKIASKEDNKISLIFEDDVLLDNDFPEKLKDAIEKLSKIKWDICYSDKGSLIVEPKIIPTSGKIALYKPIDKRSNTTGSYLIKSTSAKKLLKLMKKIAVGPDMELTYVQKKYGLKVYWTIPFLTHQGSIEEVYQSNVRTGSLAGKAIKLIKKIERINPHLAKLIAKIIDLFIKIVYRSKVLFVIKDKFKKLIGLQ